VYRGAFFVFPRSSGCSSKRLEVQVQVAWELWRFSAAKCQAVHVMQLNEAWRPPQDLSGWGKVSYRLAEACCP